MINFCFRFQVSEPSVHLWWIMETSTNVIGEMHNQSSRVFNISDIDFENGSLLLLFFFFKRILDLFHRSEFSLIQCNLMNGITWSIFASLCYTQLKHYEKKTILIHWYHTFILSLFHVENFRRCSVWSACWNHSATLHILWQHQYNCGHW